MRKVTRGSSAWHNLAREFIEWYRRRLRAERVKQQLLSLAFEGSTASLTWNMNRGRARGGLSAIMTRFLRQRPGIPTFYILYLFSFYLYLSFPFFPLSFLFYFFFLGGWRRCVAIVCPRRITRTRRLPFFGGPFPIFFLRATSISRCASRGDINCSSDPSPASEGGRAVRRLRVRS